MQGRRAAVGGDTCSSHQSTVVGWAIKGRMGSQGLLAVLATDQEAPHGRCAKVRGDW